MTSIPTETDSHRQLLVHCSVENLSGTCGSRFVDQQTYPLWQSAVAQRHGLTTTFVNTCVWLPDPEFNRQQNLFLHSGFQEAVVRLCFASYNPHTHITERKIRFVSTRDETSVLPLLTKHFRPGYDTTEPMRLTRTPGWAVASPAAGLAA